MFIQTYKAMKTCLIIACLFTIGLAPVLGQTKPQKARPNNFVYMLSDQAPGTDSLKILDSLVHLSSPIKLIKFIMYGGSETDIAYNLIYQDGSKWMHEAFLNKRKQQDSISFLVSSTIAVDADIFNAHGIYFHTVSLADKRQDRYGYYLIKGGKIVQSLMCETPFREIDNKELLELMPVFSVFDRVKSKH